MLTGDEQVWKEVQESLKKIEELKAHWSILFGLNQWIEPYHWGCSFFIGWSLALVKPSPWFDLCVSQ